MTTENHREGSSHRLINCTVEEFARGNE